MVFVLAPANLCHSIIGTNMWYHAPTNLVKKCFNLQRLHCAIYLDVYVDIRLGP